MTRVMDRRGCRTEAGAASCHASRRHGRCAVTRFPHETGRFRDAFVGGLTRLLRDDAGLGAFILVLNNALFDEQVHARLRDDLRRRFDSLARDCADRLARGADPDAPADDLLVFLKLMAIGFERFAPTRYRQAGPWEVQYNPLRALRPTRVAGQMPTGNRAPFDPSGFHFDKPFLRREAFWSGQLDGVAVELLFNKFPFIESHALLVPERDARRAQWLEPRDHQLAWGLVTQWAEGLGGIGLGYNSYGASASINHLHFQLFVRERPLPVERAQWVQRGGAEPFPAECLLLNDPAAAWDWIDRTQRAGISFNLLYRPGQLYALPRVRQGDPALPATGGALAWYEMAGGVLAFDAGAFEGLSPDWITTRLRASRVPSDSPRSAIAQPPGNH